MNILLNLLAAGLCGAIIGIERKVKNKPAGLKTMMLISIGSMLFTESALLLPGMDPLRVTGQIVSGIGFLGAGVIIRGAGDKVNGLTTAALVWVSSSLGVLSGLGYGLYAIGVSVIVTGLVLGVGYLETKLFPRINNE